MPRRQRRKGRLIQKPQNKKRNRVEEQKFRIIASSDDLTNFWTVGYSPTFERAKNEIDNLGTSDVIYYIYSDNNRVLYSTRGETDG